MPDALSGPELHSILERIGKALHDRYDALTREQLPSRWVDLIHYLDDKEREQADARRETEPPRKPEPPPEY
jgi:hypothetical protein